MNKDADLKDTRLSTNKNPNDQPTIGGRTLHRLYIYSYIWKLEASSFVNVLSVHTTTWFVLEIDQLEITLHK